jgi:hypothetical protein
LEDGVSDPKAVTDLPELRRLADCHVDPLASAIMKRAADEIEDLRESVVAFGGLWAVAYGCDAGWPSGHLHPTHYDILARAGARLDDFVRHEGVVHG